MATIAVIEPDRVFCTVLTEILADEGHAVIAATSCQHVASILDEVPVDALVIATTVPATEVETLLADPEDPPPVVCVGLRPPPFTSPTLRFVPTPFDVQELIDAVTDLLNRA